MLRNCYNFNGSIICSQAENDFGYYNFLGNFQSFLRDCHNFNYIIDLQVVNGLYSNGPQKNYSNFFEKFKGLSVFYLILFL